MAASSLCLAALILSVLAVGLPASAAPRDAGASYNLLLSKRLNDDWFLISRSNLASRDHFGDNFFAYTGAALGYRIDNRYSVRLGYRHARIRPGERWLDEHRPFAELYFADTFDGYRVTNRSRVERRLFDYRDDDVRLRHELVVEAPASVLGGGLRPYVEEELFYSTRDDRVESNWLGVGLAWRPARGIKLKAGYRWNRFRIGDEWRDRDVLVVGVNLFL